MTLTLKKDIQKHVVAHGDYALAAADQPLFTCIGSGNNAQILYNVLPGQLVAYTINNGVTVTVDDATIAASDIYELYIGVGVDLNGDGITDDIRHIGIEQVSGCEPREVSTSSPRCGNPQVVDFYFDCTQCDETYSVIVRIDDNKTRSFSPWNKSFSEFVGSIVTQCSQCGDCPVEHNCKEVACKLSDALNNELDLKIGNGSYPDWKGKGLPRPYLATRLHENSYVYCLAPQTDSDCEDCTYLDAITGALINGTQYNFQAVTNPLDATQTLIAQAKSVEAQLNDAFIQEYSQGQVGVNPHAGSAHITGTYQQCCSLQLHINTCDSAFELLDVDSNPIVGAVKTNPFSAHGTVVDDTNCIDCGSNLGVKSSGTLTLTGLPLDTETVVVGTKTYTFQDTLTNVDGNVLIGVDAEASLDNLRDAINRGSGSGTRYAAATVKHPTTSAVDGAGDTLVINAQAEGTAGDAIATTETLTNGSFGGATLSGGSDGDLGSSVFPCGIRIIAEQVKGDCGCYIDQPLAFYGRKVQILPFGDGWKRKPWRVAEVQAMELPAGFGSWIQWLEYQDLPEGRGRKYSRSNVNKGWANLPGSKSRIKNAVTAKCDKNYCSYYMKSFIEKKKICNEYGVLTIHSNIHIPSTDSATVASWEAFFTALIALNPSCKQLSVVNCDTNLGGC